MDKRMMIIIIISVCFIGFMSWFVYSGIIWVVVVELSNYFVT